MDARRAFQTAVQEAVRLGPEGWRKKQARQEQGRQQYEELWRLAAESPYGQRMGALAQIPRATVAFPQPTELFPTLANYALAGAAEAATFGLSKPPIRPPETTAQKLAYWGGLSVGYMPATMASYAATAPLFAKAAPATRVGKVVLEGVKGMTAGAAMGVPTAAVKVAKGEATLKAVPKIIAREAIIGSINDWIFAAIGQIMNWRAARGIVKELNEVAEAAKKGAAPQELVDMLRRVPETGDPAVDTAVREVVQAASEAQAMPEPVKAAGEAAAGQPEVKGPKKEKAPKVPQVETPQAPSEAPARPEPITWGKTDIKPGDVVYDIDTGTRFTVVSAEDPATLKVQTDEGTVLTQGRARLTKAPPAGPEAPAAKPPPQPKPYEGLRLGTYEWMDVWRKHPELQNEMIAYMRRLEAQESALNRTIEANLQRVRAATAGPEPLGVVAKGAELEPATLEIPKAPTPEAERAITAHARMRTWWEHIKNRVKRHIEDIADAVQYHRDVADYPSLRNATRLFEGAVQDVQDRVIKALVGVVGDLKADTYELFRRIVVVRDLIETSVLKGQLPEGVTVDVLRDYLNQLMEMAPPDVLRALERHQKLIEAIGDELVKRGLLSEELRRTAYFPHYVLDYLDDPLNFPYMPRKLREPYRFYTKKRIGSLKDIDTDYLGVMYRYLGKVMMDQEMDDFMARVALEYDLLPKMRPEDMLETFGPSGPQPRYRYHINGKEYVGWQYHPGRHIFPAVTPIEASVADALAQGKTVAEWLGDAVEIGPKGGVRLKADGEALRRIAALGRYRRVYVLPVEVAKHLDNLRYRQLAPYLEALAEVTAVWKRLTLGFSGLPFQINNAVGDLLNLYREDPAALAFLRDAYEYAVHGKVPKSLESLGESLSDLIRQQRVTGSGFVGGFYNPIFSVPELAKLQPGRAEMIRWNPLNLYEEISRVREDIPRLAKFFADLDRILQGKQVVTRSIDITGLEPIEAAGKVAREFTVDYGKLTPTMKGARRLFFPFLTFWVGNAQNWFNYVLRNPGDFTLRFGVPLGILWLWNNTVQKDVEARLPEYYRWMPHLNTGFKTADGKPIIIAFQTPLDMAARIVGLDRLPDKITRVLNGEMTAEEAALEQLKDMGLAPFRTLYNLTNPMIKTVVDLVANRDSFTGAAIVPERLRGTTEERQLQIQYAAKQFITPYAQYLRAQQELEPGDKFWRMLATGPLDVQRALGIREVDLEAAARRRFWEAVDEAERAARERKNQLEEAYIIWQVTGDATAWNRVIAERGATSGEVQALARNPRVWIEIYERKLRQTSDPAERQKLQEAIRFWREVQQVEAWKTVPRIERGTVPIGGGGI